jgi:hypothetical protein
VPHLPKLPYPWKLLYPISPSFLDHDHFGASVFQNSVLVTYLQQAAAVKEHLVMPDILYHLTGYATRPENATSGAATRPNLNVRSGLIERDWSDGFPPARTFCPHRSGILQ